MSNFLKNNPMALRHCILFEVLQGTLIDEAYYKFCDTIGEDFMEYREFDFWYYRFFNGELDPDFEMDKNEKSHELMDMPIDVLTKIVEYLDVVDRIKLARTSRSFQTFVEDQKLFQKTLELSLSRYISGVSFGESVNIHYIRRYLGCARRCTPQQALLYFKSIIKNPKLYLDTLKIDLDVGHPWLEPFSSFVNAIYDLEKGALKFTHYLNVKELFLAEYSWDQLSKILPSLKPGYLTTIRIISYNPNEDSMKKVFEMKQWKQAKRFDMYGHEFIWPLHHLYHFKEFSVYLKKFSPEDFRQMKKMLFKSPDFEKCSLYFTFSIDMSIFDLEFGNALRENPVIYHYPIPNSTEYFEIKVDGWTLEIQRQKS